MKKKEEEYLKRISDEWQLKRREEQAFLDENLKRVKELENQCRVIIQEHEQKNTACMEREKKVLLAFLGEHPFLIVAIIVHNN